MRRVLDLRIVRWELKLVYAVVAWIAGYLIMLPLTLLGAPSVLWNVVNSITVLGPFILGARIFRGQGELIAPPRPWWKMTARPTLSRRLGVLFVVWGVVLIVGTVATARGVPMSKLELGDQIVACVEVSVLAYLYLNSAVRLKRAGVQPKEPKFRPKLNLT